MPGSGTRSLLFRFGEVTYGGELISASDDDFEPGSDHRNATLDLWEADSATVVVGAEFVVYYGGDVGHGIVRTVPTHA